MKFLKHKIWISELSQEPEPATEEPAFGNIHNIHIIMYPNLLRTIAANHFGSVLQKDNKY